MVQTEMVKALLERSIAHCEVELLPLTTIGDERLKWSLELEGGKGLFTSELEQAILDGRADLAVHSSKDLPTDMDTGLALAGFLERASAHDVLIRRAGVPLLKKVATASPRRRAQLAQRLPGLEWTEIRGNVGTRLRKITEGHADATLLAAAGLSRLGITSYEGLLFEPLSIEASVPAAGQGAIAIQCRVGETERFAPIVCEETGLAVRCERTVLAAMGGGCHSATAAHWVDGVLHVFDESFGYQRLELPTGLFAVGELEQLITAWKSV